MDGNEIEVIIVLVLTSASSHCFPIKCMKAVPCLLGLANHVMNKKHSQVTNNPTIFEFLPYHHNKRRMLLVQC